MDALKTAATQLQSVLQRLSAGQRVLAIAIPIVLMTVLVWLAVRGQNRTWVPLSAGRVMSSEEVQQVQRTLVQQGMTDFEMRDGQLLVPMMNFEQYREVLVKHGRGGEDLAPGWDKVSESPGIFATQAQLAEQKDQRLKQELAQIISNVPGIEWGTVRWAKETPTGRFARHQKRKATVFVVPSEAIELDSELVHALRHGVASAVSDLEPEHVTVFDVNAGRAYTADATGAEVVSAENANRERIRLIKQHLAEQLSYIPRVRIGVTIHADQGVIHTAARVSPAALPGRSPQNSRVPLVRRSGSNGVIPVGMLANPNRELRLDDSDMPIPDESAPDSVATIIRQSSYQEHAGMSGAVHVTVGIPRSYYLQVLKVEGFIPEKGMDREEYQMAMQRRVDVVERDVAHTVATLIGTRLSNVHVGSFVDMDAASSDRRANPGTGLPDIRAWLMIGGVVVLTGFAVRVCRGGAIRQAGGVSSGVDVEKDAAAQSTGITNQNDQSGDSAKNRVESVIRQKPEMAAALLSRWIDDSVGD